MQRKARIKVEKLTYHYGSGQPVLKNISFETGKGECIALIGQNGPARPPWPSTSTACTGLRRQGLH